MSGLNQANQLYSQTVGNQFLQPNLEAALRKQQLSNQVLQASANIAPQMSAAQLAYNQARVPNLNAATQLVLGGQLPTSQAQAGLIGTETAKNQFQLQNPALMLPPGMPQQLGALAILKNLMPSQYGNNQVAPPTQDQNFVDKLGTGVPERIPGMPSAGNFVNQGGSPTIPQQTPPPPPIGGTQNVGGVNVPSNQEFANLMVKGMVAPIQEKISQADYYQSRASGYNFQSLPPTEKSYMIAQAAGMGVDPMQAAAQFNNGATIQSIAQQKGLDPNNLPTPLYAATPATVQLIQRRDQALNEINSIMPNITSSMAPYARQFAGFSPSQIAGAINNADPDQQARFLAAKALMPEMASLRLKAMGGNIGIEAIREVNNQSMGNIKSFQGLVSPKVYQSAQNYVDQWINQGADAANRVGLAGTVGNLNTGGKPLTGSTMTGAVTPSQVGVQTSSVETPQYAPNASVSMIAPNGEKITVLGSNVNEALKRGAKL